jgi:hypothetical protein
LYEDNNTFFGDLSAILIDNMPIWAEFSSTPSSKISLMGDWETKLPAIINETINENVTSLAGVPSWMLVLLQKALATTGKSNLLEVWPNAEVYFHGGVSFEPYKEQYKKLFPKDNFKYYEIYNASEGFFAIQDQNDSDELLLMLDYGIFYEFIPMDTFGTLYQRVIRLNQVELHKNYALVITTNSGLWRYLIGDTIRFTSLQPYRIKVTGRTKHHINVFGEELMIENTDAAIAKTCKDFNCEIIDYTVAPIFMTSKQKGAHEWIIEFKIKPDNIENLSEIDTLKRSSVKSVRSSSPFNNLKKSLVNAGIREINRQLTLKARILNKTINNIRNSIPGIGKMSEPTNVYSGQGQFESDIRNSIRNFVGDSIKGFFRN